jgi:DNA repair exonuclease SbcCD nuclease subunit
VTKILFVGDIHIADTPPGYRTNTYRYDILAKLEWLMGEANRLEVDLVCLNGDIFHRRTAVSSKLIADVADVLGIALAHRLILPGNHDLAPGNQLNSIYTQPVGLLGRMKHTKIALEPYPLDDVLIYPVPYTHEMRYAECEILDKLNAARPRYVIRWVHYAVTPKPVIYHSLVTDSNEWPAGAELTVCGHIHDDLGVWRDIHSTPVVNLGAISRGSLTEHNLGRTPRVLLVTATDTGLKLQAIKLPIRPAADVFRLADKIDEQDAEQIAAEFVERLGETKLGVISVEEIIKQITGSDTIPDRVAQLCAAALEAQT